MLFSLTWIHDNRISTLPFATHCCALMISFLGHKLSWQHFSCTLQSTCKPPELVSKPVQSRDDISPRKDRETACQEDRQLATIPTTPWVPLWVTGSMMDNPHRQPYSHSHHNCRHKTEWDCSSCGEDEHSYTNEQSVPSLSFTMYQSEAGSMLHETFVCVLRMLDTAWNSKKG